MAPADSHDFLTDAAALHRRMLTFDSHIDLPPTAPGGALAGDTGETSRFDLAKADRSRLSGAALVLHAGAARSTPDTRRTGLAELHACHQTITDLVAASPGRVGVAHGPDEFRAHVDAGRFAIVIGLQNADPLGDDLDALDDWAERGVRLFAFTFIGNNRWADSARPYPFVTTNSSGGLSELGVAGVRRLNDLGVLVDVSQLSSRALAAVLEHSRSPVVASHSGVRGRLDADRNFSDQELDALKRNGGVVQIVGFGPYLRELSDERLTALSTLWPRNGLDVTGRLSDLLSVNDPVTAGWDEETFTEFLHEFHETVDLGNPIATVSDLVDSIDHAVERIGIDQVGIGSDFNHGGGLRDWRDVSQNHHLTAELLRRGYRESEIAKLWGENFLRVWARATELARR